MYYTSFDAFTLYIFYGHQSFFYFGINTDIFILKEIFWGGYLEKRTKFNFQTLILNWKIYNFSAVSDGSVNMKLDTRSCNRYMTDQKSDKNCQTTSLSLLFLDMQLKMMYRHKLVDCYWVIINNLSSINNYYLLYCWDISFFCATCYHLNKCIYFCRNIHF